MNKIAGFTALYVTLLTADPAGARAQSPPPDAHRRLMDLSLDELLDEPLVTSVSRKEQRRFEAAAAVAVVTAEDIRRSGLTSLPEVLRMVPGLDVARVNGNEWAVSARGFNGQYATKLLVLLDGRSLYTPMFAGVYWSAQDIQLDNVERIEVIRGPGATLWGANAVNGIINIITKRSRDTQGTQISAAMGTETRPDVSMRYGAKIGGNLFYRAYARHVEREGFMAADGDSPDDWRTTRGGMRLDWEPPGNDQLTLQGEYYEATVGERFERVMLTAPYLEAENQTHRNSGGHALARWGHRFSEASQLSTQFYYDRFRQGDGDVTETRDTLDLDIQHQFQLNARQDIIWGLGYRHTSDELPPSFYLTFFPPQQTNRYYNAFIQDEIALVPEKLELTLGSKFEHNDYTGSEVLPNILLLWTPNERQTLWGAISRAVRIPGRYDSSSRLNSSVSVLPDDTLFLVSLISTPDAVAERLLAHELGYRVELGKRVSLDIATFYNDYDKHLSYVAGPVITEATPAPEHLLLPLYFRNSFSAGTYGAEISAQWTVTENLKIAAGYSWLKIKMNPEQSAEEENPQHQAQLRSYLKLAHQVQLTCAAYYVSGITAPLDNDEVRIDSYLRIDSGVILNPRPDIEIGLWGQNLLGGRHAEFGTFKTSQLTTFPRSVTGRIVWRF